MAVMSTSTWEKICTAMTTVTLTAVIRKNIRVDTKTTVTTMATHTEIVLVI